MAVGLFGGAGLGARSRALAQRGFTGWLPGVVLMSIYNLSRCLQLFWFQCGKRTAF